CALPIGGTGEVLVRQEPVENCLIDRRGIEIENLRGVESGFTRWKGDAQNLVGIRRRKTRCRVRDQRDARRGTQHADDAVAMPARQTSEETLEEHPDRKSTRLNSS